MSGKNKIVPSFLNDIIMAAGSYQSMLDLMKKRNITMSLSADKKVGTFLHTPSGKTVTFNGALYHKDSYLRYMLNRLLESI